LRQSEKVVESVIVSCPACTTRFSLDAALLGESGRNVRCAKCGHKWKQVPPKLEAVGAAAFDEAQAATAPAEAPAAPSPANFDSNPGNAVAEPSVEIPAAPPRPRSPQRPTGPITIPPKLRPVMPKRRGAFRPAYIVLTGIVIGLMGALFYFRAEIARAVPAFDMVYSLMGISTSNPAKDLDIGNLVFDRRNADGQTVISVQGDIFNKSEFPVQLPNMTAIPLGKDESGNSIVLSPSHRFRLEQQVIEPGETITFRTLFNNPPKGAKSLMVDFLK
jgi:predicted Zn finger-like uncharacterized protein